jgi:hypothetical protein
MLTRTIFPSVVGKRGNPRSEKHVSRYSSLTKIEQILTKIEGKIIKRTAREVALCSPGASLKLISNFIIATRMKNRSGMPKWKDTRLYNHNNGKKLKEIICLIATAQACYLNYIVCSVL